jgi:hypothetical protein
MSGAIDKLEVRAPSRVAWTRELQSAARFAARRNTKLPYHQGGQYEAMVDLRNLGLSSRLYLTSRATGSHKLVLIGVGAMSYEEILNQLRAVFVTDVLALRIARIDLAVDVFGYSVAWFRDHTYVAKKRSGGEIGKSSYGAVATRVVETLYFGTRPNLFRIYDKWAQLEAEAARDRRRIQRFSAASDNASEPPSYDTCLTRVERQYGVGKIPMQLATVGALAKDALEINPFESLQFTTGTDISTVPAHFGASTYLKVLGLKALIASCGYQGALKELNPRNGGKGKRLADALVPYMQDGQRTKSPNLASLYRQFLSAQLAPNGGTTVCLRDSLL